MLVCSVALRPKRGAIAATVTEVVTATDALSIGAIFAILADVPGTSSDYLDAFVGKRMVETASAVDVVNAGSLRNAAIVEETNAASLLSGSYASGIPVSLAEPTTANSTQDGSIVSAMVAKQAFAWSVFVNSDGTARQANVDGTMLNL